MSVVWLILKIIGITLLCILGLVLLILALVLFVPIRYQIEGTAQSKEDYHAKVHVHWLLRAVSIKLGLDSPMTMSTRVRILGIFGKGKDSVKKLGKKGEDEDDSEEDIDEESAESVKDDDKPKDSGREDAAKPEGSGKDDNTKPKESGKDDAAKPVGSDKDDAGKPEDGDDADKPHAGESEAASAGGTAETHVKPPKEDNADGDSGGTDDSEDAGEDSGKNGEENSGGDSNDDGAGGSEDAEDSEDSGEPPKKRKLAEKLADLKETAACVLELFARRKDVAVAYVKKDTTKAAISKLWKAVLWLLKTIAPRKGKAELIFGMKDPQMTGNIFSAAATLYPWYGDHITVIPDFEGEHLEGDGFIKGRIRLIGVLVWAIRLYFDKNLKRVYKEFKSVKEQMLSTPADVKKIISKAA